MESSDELVQSALAMVDRRKCENCWFGQEGKCSLYSVQCANDVLRHVVFPSRWLSYLDGERSQARLLGKQIKKEHE